MSVPKYSKEQIVNSARYGDYHDVLDAILEDGELYTLKKVDETLKSFLDKEGK